MNGNYTVPFDTEHQRPRPDMVAICEAVGVPYEQLRDHPLDELAKLSTQAIYLETEVTISHGGFDPQLHPFFGAAQFNEGSFGRRVRDLLESPLASTIDPSLRGQLELLVTNAATELAVEVASGKMALTQPLVEITGNTVRFDDAAVELPAAPRMVIDYGPGLQGRFRIKEQAVAFNAERVPYAYAPFSKGLFINQFLTDYWRCTAGGVVAGRQMVQALSEEGIFIPRNDGLGPASTSMIEFMRRAFGSAEQADLILASGIHLADPGELQTGLANAHQLLRPGGALLIRAPKQPAADHVCTAEMVAMAQAGGFTPLGMHMVEKSELREGHGLIEVQSVLLYK